MLKMKLIKSIEVSLHREFLDKHEIDVYSLRQFLTNVDISASENGSLRIKGNYKEIEELRNILASKERQISASDNASCMTPQCPDEEEIIGKTSLKTETVVSNRKDLMNKYYAVSASENHEIIEGTLPPDIQTNVTPRTINNARSLNKRSSLSMNLHQVTLESPSLEVATRKDDQSISPISKKKKMRISNGSDDDDYDKCSMFLKLPMEESEDKDDSSSNGILQKLRRLSTSGEQSDNANTPKNCSVILNKSHYNSNEIIDQHQSNIRSFIIPRECKQESHITTFRNVEERSSERPGMFPVILGLDEESNSSSNSFSIIKDEESFDKKTTNESIEYTNRRESDDRWHGFNFQRE